MAAKTQAHKAKLAADPRFAAWLGIDQDPPPDPATERRIAERNELIRIAAQRIVENEASGAPTADPATLAWARDFVATTGPLGGSLGTGEPDGLLRLVADLLPIAERTLSEHGLTSAEWGAVVAARRVLGVTA